MAIVDGLSALRRGVFVDPLGFGLLLALCVASLPLFVLGFSELGQAWGTAEYSHGPLIPLISLYLFLRELRRAPPSDPSAPVDRRPGIAVLALGLVLALFGNLVQIGDIVAYAFIVWTMGVVLLGFGWARGRRHWAPGRAMRHSPSRPTAKSR